MLSLLRMIRMRTTQARNPYLSHCRKDYGREAKRIIKWKTLWDPRPPSLTDSYFGDARTGRLTGGASYSWSSSASDEQRNLQLNPAAPSFASGRCVSKRERALLPAIAETTCSIQGHTNVINAVRWSPEHASLLALTAMDNAVRV
ncbi:hypothetical protein R1flu_005167 [Riccia fluitans]|uniref:Uncharacterized protein n=1 Tax=Riccia fluitans TaxID=41844 RepID=A0ABD1YSN9_9MARC